MLPSLTPWIKLAVYDDKGSIDPSMKDLHFFLGIVSAPPMKFLCCCPGQWSPMWELQKNLCYWITWTNFLVPGRNYITVFFFCMWSTWAVWLSLWSDVGPVGAEERPVLAGMIKDACSLGGLHSSGLSIREETLISEACAIIANWCWEGGTQEADQPHGTCESSPAPPLPSP